MNEVTMTPRERILCALGGGQPDRVPIFDWVNNPALYVDLLGREPGIYDGALAVELARRLGLDAAWVPAGGFMGLPSERFNWDAGGQSFVDEWDTRYTVGAGSWPLAFPQTHPVRTRADWEGVAAHLPDPTAVWRTDYARSAVAVAHGAVAHGDAADGQAAAGGQATPGADIAVLAGIRGPFSSAWMLMGLAEMSLTLVDDPGLLGEIFATTADYWTEVGLSLVASGVDAIVVHDDQGSGTSTFFAPASFRRHVLPYLAAQIAALTEAGVPVILHSCGNINAILPDLVGTGIAGLNNLQRAARMDLAAVKAQYGLKLCLIGNVDATNLLPYASAAEIETAVIECLRLGAPGGAYILATDHSFHEGISVANVQAFITAGKQHGSYANA